jgi:tRNA U34 5-methylaminomethyl-2-thiouridine-forming methyltransferase MnmC
LIVGDALVEIPKISKKFDVIIFDPFSPKKQPELWTQEFFSEVSKLAKKGCVLTTYSCARVAKDGLTKAGFSVSNGPCIGRRAPSLIAVKTRVCS